MPEMSVLFLMLYFRIRKRSFTYRTPVNDPGSFIDIAFLIQADKYFLYCFGTSFIHGKTLSVPVAGYAQFLQLPFDRSCIFFFPLPGSLQEFFSSQLFFVNSLFLQLIRNLHLGRNCCMVRSRDPEGIISLHSLIADQDILQCIVQRVPHMKLSGYIRRGHYGCKRFSASVYFCMKIFVLTPFVIKFWFNLFWIVGFFQILAHVFPPHNVVCANFRYYRLSVSVP